MGKYLPARDQKPKPERHRFKPAKKSPPMEPGTMRLLQIRLAQPIQGAAFQGNRRLLRHWK